MSHTKYVTPCAPFRLFPTCKSALVGAVLRDVKIFTPLCRYIYRSLVLYCKTTLTKCALVTRNAQHKINRFTTLRVRRRAAHQFNFKKLKKKVLLVYVPLFPKTGVMFPCSLRYFPFVPLFPKTPGRPSGINGSESHLQTPSLATLQLISCAIE